MQWIYLILVIVPVQPFYTNSTENSGNLISTPCTDKNHFFLAPGVLTAGGTNRACVSRFYPEGSARMLLTLISEDKMANTASRELPPGDGGCLDIAVPLLPNTKADLIVNIWYPEEKCTWERRVSLRISSGRVVVVHTERARYRPGDTLRARVFALKADLTPAPGVVEEIWIEGPPGAWEGARVAQWSKVRSKMGLAQVQHDIDELAPPGRWTVRARLGDGSQGSAVFWVGNYELPPFQLTVRHAPRVLRTSERLAWTVCVRYPWTEAVEGMLVIRLRGAGAGAGNEGVGIRTAVRLRAPRACHRHAAAARRVGLGGEFPPDVLVADFSFQEEGTRVWQNTTVVSQVVDKPITLEFVTKHHTVISPGLPYKLKVKATRWDDKPVSNEKIRVCRYSAQTINEAESKPITCINEETDPTGVARVIFPAEDDASPFYRFEASLHNDSTTTTAPLTLATRRSPIQAALGPLRADTKGTRTFVPLYLNLQNVTSPVTVHFVVITRGGIIYRWGATTQCPIASSASVIQTATRNSKCNDPMAQYDNDNNNNKDNNKTENRNARTTNYDINLNLYVNQNQNINIHYPNKTFTRNMNQHDKNNYIHKLDKNEPNNQIYDKFSPIVVKPNVFVKVDDTNSTLHEVNASEALLDRHLLRVMLPIKVTQQMCPDSHLIAYFYYNGEFVSASKHFEMDDCFVNKVEATFLSRQALPGSLTTLQVSTPGPALCALTALDSASRWSSSYAVKEFLMKGLKRMIDGHRNVTEYDAAGDCFLTAETPPLPTNSLELAATWLAAAGVRTVGNIPVRRTCDTPASLIDEGTIPRSDFSEAWLWRLITVGANGSAVTSAQAPDSITRYEANAVCLSKSGIAISPPAVLQVFREFFIHADSPKRLRQGDSTIIRYRLFNYLYEPLSVQIQLLTGAGLQGPTNVVESVCIPPRASTARRSPVTATAAGEGTVTIRAKAVNDGGCGNHSNSKRGVSDEVIMKIVVEPEGVPVQQHKSMLLCGKDNSNSTSSHVSWSFSAAKIIPGTETMTVWAAGDIIGPLIADADSLVLLPRGCGEQNMARLATNLLALDHIHPHTAAALAAREHVARGLTRQLQYVHPSGGFCAFGPSDATSSTWLTAFSLRYLRRAHKLLYPHQPLPSALEAAERWLLNQQMENGCFRNEGQVFHRELRGGLNEEGEIASVALTAYVITSLLQSTSPLPLRILRNTLSCLRALPAAKYNSPGRVYAHSLLAYAFIRIKKYEDDLRRTNEARYEDLRSKPEKRNPEEVAPLQRSGIKEHEGLLEVMELIKMATREGEFLWWETGSLSTSIEATSYALLALRESPSALREFGAGSVRWLAAHRGPSGGFVSTQDTLVALEALSAWSSLQPSPSNLTVSARSGTVTKQVRLDPAVHIPEVLYMGTGDQISIGVEGSGCALVQATRSYHTPSSARSQHQLSVQLSLHTDGTFDCDSLGTNCFCAAIVQACAVWSGSFPEMALLEVSLPGGYAADAAKLYSQLNEPNTLLRRIELSPSNSRATLYLASRAGATLPRRGHACFNLHAVGPRARTRPAYVRLLDYYTPTVNDTQIYTIPEECPSRITHESTQDMTSDNLYEKARSHSDKGEILISHEFTFEDIPEGIPLDDPLYDNLTRKDKDISDLTMKLVADVAKKHNNVTVDNKSTGNYATLNNSMNITTVSVAKFDNTSLANVNISSNNSKTQSYDIIPINDEARENMSNNIHNSVVSEIPSIDNSSNTSVAVTDNVITENEKNSGNNSKTQSNDIIPINDEARENMSNNIHNSVVSEMPSIDNSSSTSVAVTYNVITENEKNSGNNSKTQSNDIIPINDEARLNMSNIIHNSIVSELPSIDNSSSTSVAVTDNVITENEKNSGNEITNSTDDVRKTNDNITRNSNDQSKAEVENNNKDLYEETLNMYKVRQNPLPYIPFQSSGNANNQLFKNIVFNVPEVVKKNSKINTAIKIDDKLDMHNLENYSNRRVILNPTHTNKVKVSIISGGKRLDVYYNDEKTTTVAPINNVANEVTTRIQHSNTDAVVPILHENLNFLTTDATTMANNFRDKINSINQDISRSMTTVAPAIENNKQFDKKEDIHIHHEKQRSITTEANTVKDDSKLTNNENSNKLVHKTDTCDEHKDKLIVENPKLSAFHVIDTEKDLEVPSGIEGPVPSIVLPPANFEPPENMYYTSMKEINELKPKASNIQTSVLLPPLNDANYVHHFIPNIAPRHTLPKGFNIQNALPNNFVPQNVMTFDPQNRLSSFASQDFVPNNFDPQNGIYPPFGMSAPSHGMVPPPPENGRINHEFFTGNSNPNYLRRSG